MTDDAPLIVDCDVHGKGVAAVVCRHLCTEKAVPLGFVENSDTPGDRQAWCDQCEAFFLEQGDLTEEFQAFNDMALVCEACYEIIRNKHAR